MCVCVCVCVCACERVCVDTFQGYFEDIGGPEKQEDDRECCYVPFCSVRGVDSQ